MNRWHWKLLPNTSLTVLYLRRPPRTHNQPTVTGQFVTCWRWAAEALCKKNLCDSKWKWHSVSGVCVWICVVVLRDPSTPPEAKKKITCLFFDLCDVTRTLSCSSQGLNICNDCVLNKPPSCFFLFKPSLLLLLYNHQVTTHTRMLYIELFIIKDCTLIFQSTYYMYKWRADRFQYFYPLNWAGTLFFFFFALLESEQAKYIKALAAVSWNGDVWKLKKN